MADDAAFTGGSGRATLRPTAPAPALTVRLLGGGIWTLAEQRPERFTMIVFYRGFHCPVCRAYLRDLDRRLEDFASRGVDVLAISGDDEARARATREDWGLERLRIGYGQSVASMRAWGLFVSRGIKDGEPPRFGEPGLFLVRPDATLFYIALNSMPFGRPSLADMLGAIDFVAETNYPARGEL
ncbi:MAG TPA: peroxiredoxin-like family protein [Gemmatimonadaceae bacterium]